MRVNDPWTLEHQDTTSKGMQSRPATLTSNQLRKLLPLPGNSHLDCVGTSIHSDGRKPLQLKTGVLSNWVRLSAIMLSLLLSASIVPLWQLVYPPAAVKLSPLSPSQHIVGKLFFASRGQMDAPGASLSANDSVTITLWGLAPLTPGNRYDAWLLPDPSHDNEPAIFLGNLPLSKSNATLTYTDLQHTDLLATMSRFLLTAENDRYTPLEPPLDVSTLRYKGTIPTLPAPGDKHHLSYLDHLRHLLVQDPILIADGFSGGLGTWLLQRAGNVLTYTIAARDDWASAGETVSQLREQVLRVLGYLDGATGIQRDAPPGSSWLTVPNSGRIGLLAAHDMIDLHLVGLGKAPGATARQKQQSAAIVQAITHIESSLESVRSSALQLLDMSDTQLSLEQAQSLLAAMVTQATDAYIGQVSAAGYVPGVAWVYQELQSLASFPIQGIVPGPQASS